MKSKKIFIFFIIVIIVLAIIGGIIYKKKQQKLEENNMTEYIPQEEITIEQLRQTIVSIYFNEKDTNTLIPEARTIDVKELTKEPYTTLLNLLIAGPNSEKLESVIPNGTKVNKVELKNGVLYVDLSNEFIENHKGGAEAESRTIYAIVNTLTQLSEVEAVKISIDGKEDAGFKDELVKFKEAFVKQDDIT